KKIFRRSNAHLAYRRVHRCQWRLDLARQVIVMEAGYRQLRRNGNARAPRFNDGPDGKDVTRAGDRSEIPLVAVQGTHAGPTLGHRVAGLDNAFWRHADAARLQRSHNGVEARRNAVVVANRTVENGEVPMPKLNDVVDQCTQRAVILETDRREDGIRIVGEGLDRRQRGALQQIIQLGNMIVADKNNAVDPVFNQSPSKFIFAPQVVPAAGRQKVIAAELQPAFNRINGIRVDRVAERRDDHGNTT